MVNCDKIKSYLSDFIEGNIDFPLRKDIEEHVKQCPDCEPLLRRMQFMTNLLSNLSSVRTSEHFINKLHYRIEVESHNTSHPLHLHLLNWKTGILALGTLLAFVSYNLAFNITTSKSIYNSAGASKLQPTTNTSSQNKPVSVNNSIQSDKGIPVESSHIDSTKRNQLEEETNPQTNKIKYVKSVKK